MRLPTEITLQLPDIVSLTPFHWDGCNPRYIPSNRESTEWMLSFGVLSDRDRGRLIATNPELLGAYVLPHAKAKNVRIMTDVLTMLYALDAVTDVQDTEGAKATRDVFVKALTNTSGDDSSPITLFTKDFLGRFSGAPVELQKRFVEHFIGLIDGQAKEAYLRTNGDIPAIDDCFRIRRHAGGVYLPLDIIEVALGVTLPAEVHEDKDFQSILDAGNDLVHLANDIYSYVLEYEERLDGTNMITVLMHHSGLSHQQAMDRVAEIYKSRIDTLIACKASIRSFGPEVDEMIHKYIRGVQQWVCGHNAFNLVTKRFFGVKTEEVIRTGSAKLKLRTRSL